MNIFSIPWQYYVSVKRNKTHRMVDGLDSDCLPGVNIHKQHQCLHRDHVDALTVKSCNFQHFQIRYAQHDEREEERERV